MTTNLVELITNGIQERKGRSITTIDLSNVEGASASQFVICEGTSSQHVAAIADCVREHLLNNYGIKPYNYDGYRNAQWIVIDYGSVLVHIFLPEERIRYNLEELWNDGKIVEIPDLD